MISETEYAKRREKLAKSLANNSLTVLFSATYKQRSNDTEYPFRQNSNFYYLTGLKEDKSALMILKTKGSLFFFLFVHKKDPVEEMWNGKRIGVDEAKKRFLVDDVLLYENLHVSLEKYMKNVTTLYYDFNLEYTNTKILKSYFKDMYSIKNVAKKIQKMRLIKSKPEIRLIQKAINITKKAHHRAIQKAPLCKYEYELQAEIEYIFKKNGAYSDAYTSIVAGGNNANTLHYISNNKLLKKKSLILIDAGCEYDYYASDITRTIASNGHFTQAQKELYSLVLEVQKEIITMIRPKVLRSDLQKKSEELLTKGMIRLGILKGDLKTLLDKKEHKKYYPHGIGHWMGLDVHDEAPYKTKKGKEIPLKAGMVLTIEPALYIDENDSTVPKKYRGIGIRIEDNILVTKNGYKNLSQDIKKELSEISS